MRLGKELSSIGVMENCKEICWAYGIENSLGVGVGGNQAEVIQVLSLNFAVICERCYFATVMGPGSLRRGGSLSRLTTL
jgi:hypothetical protein